MRRKHCRGRRITSPHETLDINPHETLDINPHETLDINPHETLDINPHETLDINPHETLDINPHETLAKAPAEDGLFVLVGTIVLAIQVIVFPPNLIWNWPSLQDPAVGLSDFAWTGAFISTIGVLSGALAGGLDNRSFLRNLTLFREVPDTQWPVPQSQSVVRGEK